MILETEDIHGRMSLPVDRNSIDFLEHNAHDRLLENKKDNRPRRRFHVRPWLIPICIHFTILIAQVWLFVRPGLLLKATRPWIDAVTVTPALKWQNQVIDSTVYRQSPYSGNPSPDVDHAWNQLTSGFNLRVPKSTLDRLNRTSIPLSDGSGYIAGWDTTHQLHCLVSSSRPA